jgi:peptidoglycan hydrolase-like protein with peptidoglycan-binding domain
MKSTLLFAVATLALAFSALADDQLRNVQTELKSQGFYYGDVNGQTSSETTSALRRYQIRNGLEVTGTLTPETLGALGLASRKAAQPAPATAQKSQPNQPLNLRRDTSAEDSDKAFLRREENKDANQKRRQDFFSDPGPATVPPPVSTPPRDTYIPPQPPRESSVVPPPAPLDAPSADFPVLFAGTPYANAPLAVQQDTLRRAQAYLSGRGFYRDIVDGLPGPATEEALLTFQRATRLTLSGRLDLDTLSRLRLLPGSTYSGGPQFGIEFRTPHHFFRGVWVDRD